MMSPSGRAVHGQRVQSVKAARPRPVRGLGRAAAAALAGCLVTVAMAAAGPEPAAGPQAYGESAASTVAGELVAGEVRRIDRDRQRITLRHAEMANLGMPPMTMVFRVADPAWLDRVQVGDRVSFRAEKVLGNYTVTELRPAR